MKCRSYRLPSLLLLLACGALAVCCAAPGPADCLGGFPASYYVSTGTTIPLHGTALAQSGAIFSHGPLGLLRLDQFHLGQQHTFIADNSRRRAYVFETGPPEGGRERQTRCHVFNAVGGVAALCIPRAAAEAGGGEGCTVRGVPVRRYRGLDRRNGPLLQVDHYVLNASAGGLGGGAVGPLLVPWRMQSRERPAAELKGIAGAPLSVPNWRFFGQPMFDEVDFPLDGTAGGGTALAAWAAESDPVTVDFYNFVPVAPDSSVFAVPDECRRAEEAWEAAQQPEGPPAEAPAGDGGGGSQLGLPVAHRLLLGWSLAAAARAGTAPER